MSSQPQIMDKKHWGNKNMEHNVLNKLKSLYLSLAAKQYYYSDVKLRKKHTDRHIKYKYRNGDVVVMSATEKQRNCGK